MEENKTKNINFFKKLWYSITKFEKYPEMAAEGIRSAIKYLIIISFIVSIFISIGSTIEMHKVIGELANYINNNIPDFTYADGKISAEMQEPMVITEVNDSTIDQIVIDSNAETEEAKNTSKTEHEIIGNTIFFFKNQVVLVARAENGQVNEQPYTYQDFIKSYTQEDIKEFNKQELVNYMTSSGMNSYYIRYVIAIVVNLLLVNVMVALLDTLQLAILGWITTIVARIKMKFVAIYNMSIYALTLSMILNIVYIIINYFVDFTIEYFQIAYIAIAYIYLAASIFILKDDFMKRQEEVEKIKQEQIKVREEIRKQEEEKKDKEEPKEEKHKKKKEEEPKGETPDGSEA